MLLSGSSIFCMILVSLWSSTLLLVPTMLFEWLKFRKFSSAKLRNAKWQPPKTKFYHRTMGKICKNSSSLKPLNHLKANLTVICIGWFFTKWEVYFVSNRNPRWSSSKEGPYRKIKKNSFSQKLDIWSNQTVHEPPLHVPFLFYLLF